MYFCSVLCTFKPRGKFYTRKKRPSKVFQRTSFMQLLGRGYFFSVSHQTPWLTASVKDDEGELTAFLCEQFNRVLISAGCLVEVCLFQKVSVDVVVTVWITPAQSKRILIDMKLNYHPIYFHCAPIRWSNFWLDGAVKAQVSVIKLIMAEYSIWLLLFLGPGCLSGNTQPLPWLSPGCLIIPSTDVISSTWASPCTREMLWNRPISALTFCFYQTYAHCQKNKNSSCYLGPALHLGMKVLPK